LLSKTTIIKSSKLSVDSKSKELESAKNNYYPTLDTGAFYQREDEPSPFSPGTIYGAYAKVGVDIYDGGKKSYTKKQKQDEVDSAS
jgi:outer membrane protein TolC